MVLLRRKTLIWLITSWFSGEGYFCLFICFIALGQNIEALEGRSRGSRIIQQKCLLSFKETSWEMCSVRELRFIYIICLVVTEPKPTDRQNVTVFLLASSRTKQGSLSFYFLMRRSCEDAPDTNADSSLGSLSCGFGRNWITSAMCLIPVYINTNTVCCFSNPLIIVRHQSGQFFLLTFLPDDASVAWIS